MGLMGGLMSFLFGDGRNVVVETTQVFRENAEKGAVRQADAKSESLQQFAAEFLHPRRGVFDRFVDGLNRLPRPLLALGTIWLFVTAMRSPDTFIAGMEGIALVPEPLWWLMGAIVSFYFGARHQAKGQEFQRSVASSLAMAQHAKPAEVPTKVNSPKPHNAALTDWQADNGQ
jgi:hypothetical protein